MRCKTCVILADNRPYLDDKTKIKLEEMLNNLVKVGYETFVIFGNGNLVEYSLLALGELKMEGFKIQRYIMKDDFNQNLCRILMFFNRVEQVCVAPDVLSQTFTLEGKKKRMIALADGVLLYHENFNPHFQEFEKLASSKKKEIFNLF